jgi:hypothetical protein
MLGLPGDLGVPPLGLSPQHLVAPPDIHLHVGVARRLPWSSSTPMLSVGCYQASWRRCRGMHAWL